MDAEEKIVRKRLGTDRVRDVRVVSERNEDGEDILRILIVYENSKGRLTVDEMSDITDKIWRENLTSGRKGSPVPSFRSSEDKGIPQTA